MTTGRINQITIRLNSGEQLHQLPQQFISQPPESWGMPTWSPFLNISQFAKCNSNSSPKHSTSLCVLSYHLLTRADFSGLVKAVLALHMPNFHHRTCRAPKFMPENNLIAQLFPPSQKMQQMSRQQQAQRKSTLGNNHTGDLDALFVISLMPLFVCIFAQSS